MQRPMTSTSKPTKTESAISSIIGYIVAVFLVPLFFLWYNVVIGGPRLSYWQWLLIGIGYLIAATGFRPLKWVAGLIGGICIIAQFASWAGVLELPLVK